MMTVHKYPLEVDDRQDVEMPEGAFILSVQVQDGRPCLWAMVDTSKPDRPRTILMVGTGSPMPAVGRYLATFQLHGGRLVFHAFEGPTVYSLKDVQVASVPSGGPTA